MTGSIGREVARPRGETRPPHRVPGRQARPFAFAASWVACLRDAQPRRRGDPGGRELVRLLSGLPAPAPRPRSAPRAAPRGRARWPELLPRRVAADAGFRMMMMARRRRRRDARRRSSSRLLRSARRIAVEQRSARSSRAAAAAPSGRSSGRRDDRRAARRTAGRSAPTSSTGTGLVVCAVCGPPVSGSRISSQLP